MMGTNSATATSQQQGTGTNAGASADGQGGQTGAIDQLRAEQERQAGVLDRIIGMLEGDTRRGVDQAHDADRQVVDRRLDRGSRIADDVRQAVRDVQAEQAAAQAEQLHQADHARLREQQQKPAETAPREVIVSGKARLQRIMFGGDGK